MSRVKNTKKNIIYGYISTVITIILGFVLRTVFLLSLNESYLGVNGLFTNVLGVLSFAELGIGSAMNYALFKPVAVDDKKMIQSIMLFYKKVYRVIAFVVAGLGLSFLPFLHIIVKDPGDVGDIRVYYLIFLFNTVSTYFVSYKYSLVNAEQKNYIITNINALVSIITSIINIIVLIVYKNFLFYLLSISIISLLQKIFISNYLNKRYPYLLEKNIEKLSKEEIEPIKKNVSALVYHKMGDVLVHQTDNIIISSFINIATVGLLSNYNLLITNVSLMINIVFNSVTSSLGNLVATASKEKLYEIFKLYRFIAFWIYGFSAIAFYTLLSPFISLWLGENMLLGNEVILLIVINFYMLGHRIVINNLKAAAGVFNQDKYVAILQSVVNIVVSIIAVQLIGLPGVFVGTIAQGTLSTILKPIIVYKAVFERPAIQYFIDAVRYAVPVMVSGRMCSYITGQYLGGGTIADFIGSMGVVIIIPNVVFLACFIRGAELKELYKMVRRR